MFPYRLDGKVALVTGAQRGIGAEVAKLLAQAGAEVAIGHVVEPERAEAVAAEIEQGAGQAYPLCFDVTDSAQVLKAYEQLIERSGKLDILVNNAGVRADNLALRMSDSEWRKAMAVNLDGAFYCCRASLSLMRKTGGSIVNISSVAAFAGSVGQANYASAKAGLVGLTKSLAVEYASKNIRVNCIVPGLIETEMTDALKPAFREQFMSQIPMGRFGTAEEVAAGVLFFASDASSYITGAALHINGGGYPA